MSLTNITATLSNGTQVVSTAQTIAAGVTATCVDEGLVLTVSNALVAADNATARLEITDSVIKAGDVERPIATSGGTLGRVVLTRCSIHWSLAGSRRNMYASELVDTTIRSTNTGGTAFVYTQGGGAAVLNGVVLDGIYVHEIQGAPATFNNVTYRNCGLNLLNWSAGALTLTGVNLGSGTRAATSYTGADGQTYTTYDAWLGAGNGANRFAFVDSTVNLAKMAIQLGPATGTELCTKLFTRTERYVAGAGYLDGANVRFTPTASSGSSSQAAFDRTINSTGYLVNGSTEEKTATLLVQATVDSGTSRSSGLAEPSTVRDFTLRNIAWSRRVRRADILDLVTDVTPTAKTGTGAEPSKVEAALDGAFTGTVAQAAAITGAAFAVASNLVTVTVTSARTAQEIFNTWKHWTSQFAQFGVDQSLIEINNGALTVTGSVTASATVSAGGNASSIVATGTISTTGSGSYSLPVEDSAGVRVTVRKSGGQAFNIVARRGSTGSYTDLGFQSGVTTVTYTVPKGQPLEIAMWSLGCVTYTRTISTAAGGLIFDADMVVNPAINTSLDVSSYLAGISTSLDTSGASPVFVITFTQAMSVAGIELGKAVIHRIVGQELALRTMLPPGSTSTIAINADEITVNLPSVRLTPGVAIPVTGKVYLDFFINTAAALVVNPAYDLAPPRADGNFVTVLRVKPAIDPVQLRTIIEASTVLAKEATVATLASVNQTEHNATQSAVATLATSAQVTALGSPMQAGSYTAPPSAASNASAVRAELATELGRMDAAVSSRLSAAGYTAPANADIAAIKAKTDTLTNGPTLAQIEASSVLAKETTVSSLASQASVTALGSPMQASSYTAPPSASSNAAAVRTELATELGRIDATVSSRLATAGYTAPTAAPTAAANAQAVRSELATELGRIDAAVSSRSTLTMQDIPAGLTANDIWSAASRTLTQNIPTLSQIEASTVLAKEATVSSRASQSSVTSLGSPLQTSGYVPPANADIAAIKAKTDTLVNGPTLAAIEASTVLAKESTLSSRASQASVNALGTPMQAVSYVVPDNTNIAAIKAKVDTLQNTDLTGLATTANVTAAQAAIVAEVNANEVKIDAVKAKTDVLQNTDVSGIPAAVREQLPEVALIPALL